MLPRFSPWLTCVPGPLRAAHDTQPPQDGDAKAGGSGVTVQGSGASRVGWIAARSFLVACLAKNPRAAACSHTAARRSRPDFSRDCIRRRARRPRVAACRRVAARHSRAALASNSARMCCSVVDACWSPSARALKASSAAEAMENGSKPKLSDTRRNGDGYFGVTRPYALPRA